LSILGDFEAFVITLVTNFLGLCVAAPFGRLDLKFIEVAFEPGGSSEKR
jgi:hypothetical protein